MLLLCPSLKHLRKFQVECLGLLIACLGHDLDHRGTTNSFQIKAKNSLATLYSNSTMERHHLNQCLLLLNIPGNRILENMSEVMNEGRFKFIIKNWHCLVTSS